jgi:hypothetical protein
MGFIRDLFTSGSAGGPSHHDAAGAGAAEPQSPLKAQNPWRSVFNPGSPSPRFQKGSAQWHDKPEGQHKDLTVMDEMIRAPSVGQAKITNTGPTAGGEAAAATSSPRKEAAASGASNKEASHEFGMDKFGYGA